MAYALQKSHITGLIRLRIFLTLLVLLCSGPQASYAQNTDEEINDFLKRQNINSLESYAHWVQSSMEYFLDENVDRWNAPIETLKNGRGDCEDLAFLHAAVLKTFGISSRVLAVVKNKKEAHAFCVFKQHEFFYVFDNTHLIKTNSDSFESLAQFAVQSQYAPVILELNQEKQTIKPIYIHHALIAKK